MEKKHVRIRDRLPSSVECVCIGQCVGYECLRTRASALVEHGQIEDARTLLEEALRDASEHKGLREELRAVYDIIVGNHRTGGSGSGKREDGQGENCEAKDKLSGAQSPNKRSKVDDAMSLRELAEDFDCVICSKLLYEPVTTPCGHTFCRTCLSRAIDLTDTCPMCRSVLHLEDPASLPVTIVLKAALQRYFPQEYENRRKEVDADAPSAQNCMNRLPLFPLNAVVFPAQRFPMHIFEPRYRLMLRRIMHGSRKFGLIALRRMRDGSSELCDIGCVLEVTKADRIPDGRSLIETVARDRFKIIGRTDVDGYLVGRTETFQDMEGIEGEEVRQVEARAREIVNTLLEKGSRSPAVQHALHRAGSVPAEQEGPSALGMWLAGMLVGDMNERQRLLEMSNAKARLEEVTVILENLQDSMLPSSRVLRDGSASRDCEIQ